jgi:hypothetical protein
MCLIRWNILIWLEERCERVRLPLAPDDRLQPGIAEQNFSEDVWDNIDITLPANVGYGWHLRHWFACLKLPERASIECISVCGG